MNVLIFLLVACFWGGSFIAIQPLVQIVPPFTAAALRIFVAVIFLSVLFPVLKVPLSLPRNLRLRVWTTGLFAFSFPFALLFWGEKSISPGLAGILNGTVPLFAFIFGILFTPGVEKTTVRKIIGLLLGILGVLAIFLPKVLADTADSSFLGALAVTGMSMCYAVSVLLNRTIFTQYSSFHPFANLFHQMIAGLLVLGAIAISIEGLPQIAMWEPKSTVWISSLYLGVGSTSIAFICFYRLIKNWGSVRASTVTYVVPAVALLLDLIMNGSTPRWNELVGVLTITIGVIALNFPGKLRKS